MGGRRALLLAMIRSLLLGMLLIGLTAQAATDPAPAELARWRDWVLWDFRQLACPPRHDGIADSEQMRLCRFAGPLQLELDAGQGRFALEWRMYRDGWAPLPGAAEAWPVAVLADGQAIAVQATDAGASAVWLETGLHRLSGRLQWSDRPRTLSIPTDIVRIELTLDGQSVAQPDRRQQQLWLGSSEPLADQRDSLQLEVYRRLSDGNPAILETRLQLAVTGRARELHLGPVLPPGFAAMHLEGSLAQRLEADGRLRVQLAPGQHRLSLQARATELLAKVGRPPATEPWPELEIWSFQPDPKLPPTEVMDAEAVDPVQAGVPGDWQGLAAFSLAAQQSLRLQRSDLAQVAQTSNRLQLRRELWLHFDATAWTAIDQLSGQMRRDWRLDAGPQLPLQRAESAGEALLLTRSPAQGDALGVEWRSADVDLRSSARLPAGSRLPASGWLQTLDSVDLQLNLPPGYQLLAAGGADRAGTAWIARWQLGAIFLLCLGVLLAWRLGGVPLGLATAAYLLLSAGQRDAPLFSLLLLLMLCLALRWVVADGPRRWLRRVAWPALVVLLLAALPFAAQQFRLLLHPQLERGGVASSGSFNLATSQVIRPYSDNRLGLSHIVSPSPFHEESADGAAMPMARAPAAPPMEEVDQVQNVAQSSAGPMRKQAPQKLNRIDPSAVVQAGEAEPQWRWNTHRLSIAGPVPSDHQVRLWLSPPWMTALWRLLAVLTLGWVIAGLVLRLLQRKAGGRWSRWLALALCLPGSLLAAEFPSPELLQSYRERLLAPPECAPHCAQLQQVSLAIDGTRLVLDLEFHLQQAQSLPLPRSEHWQPARVSVDGQPAPWLLGHEGGTWLPLTPGIRRVRLEGAVIGERIALVFPMSASGVQAQSAGWLVSGIERGRIAAGELQLVRLAPVEAGSSPLRPAELPPFVRVVRTLSIDLDWTLLTEVQRIAPYAGAIQVRVPLLPGERLLGEDPQLVDGQAQVSLREGQDSTSWASRLDPVDQLVWQAPALSERVEVWNVRVSPIFHVDYDAPVAVLLAAEGDGSERRFAPLPGDHLQLQIARPEAVAGSTLAIDGVGVRTSYGARLRETELNLQWRATRGGQHALQLPPEAELLWLRIDGREVGLQPEQGRLQLPVRPGQQSIALALREPAEGMLRTGFPAIDLGLPAANLGLALNLPGDRWLLWASGPAIGPAVRFWSILALVVTLAVLVGRSGHSPVGTRDMLILGIGLATVAWWTLLLVAGWLLVLDWRRRRGAVGPAWSFDLLQVFLVWLSVVVLIVLIGTAWSGLLGQPAMRVEGNGSSLRELIWFADHAAGPLPEAGALSVPLWVYKAAILAWSLWLANAVVRWLRLALDALGEGGWWKSPLFPPRAPKQAAATAAAAMDGGQATEAVEGAAKSGSQAQEPER